jgi:hypothetical protein
MAAVDGDEDAAVVASPPGGDHMRSTHRAREMMCAVLLGVLVSWAFVESCQWVERVACAEDGPQSLAASILVLAPGMRPEVAQTYARHIGEAALDAGLSPHLLAAIVARESSYRHDVATCRVTGARGERGLMQIMPGGYARTFAPDDCRDQCDPECSLATGARYLAHLRATCPGSTWRWVAAYGRRSCPSEEQAREDRATRRAAALVAQIGGEW